MPNVLKRFVSVCLWIGLELAVPVARAQVAPLNDTGITWSVIAGPISVINKPCSQSNPAGQDCSYGRDAAAAAGTLQKSGGSSSNQGVANGFDFTKISNSGNALPASAALGSGASDWACTRDNVTGLIWEIKTADGGPRDQKWTYTWLDGNSPDGYAGTANGGTCQDYPNGCDTQGYAAMVNAQGLCGASDWRVPRINELKSIIDFGRNAPAIDPGYFPNTPQPYWFWADSTDASDSPSAWSVASDTGGAAPIQKLGPNRVRLVRGGPPPVTGPTQGASCIHNIPPSNPNSVYFEHDNGTVTDSRTHLMWKRCMEGQSGANCGSSGVFTGNLDWPHALAAAQASTYAGYHDWRVPSIKELFTLVELCASNPAINTAVFPGTIQTAPNNSLVAAYWSNSPYDKNLSNLAWAVDFGVGSEMDVAFDNGYLVRLVRDDPDTIFANGFDH